MHHLIQFVPQNPFEFLRCTTWQIKSILKAGVSGGVENDVFRHTNAYINNGNIKPRTRSKVTQGSYF